MTESASLPCATRRGLALTGLLAVGKSTIARRLCLEHGMNFMKTVVTRPLEGGEEDEFICLGEREFVDQARCGEIVFPFFFGRSWYGYHLSDWQKAVAVRGSNHIFNVRPYVGLILATVLPCVQPVWLELAEDIRLNRLRHRGADRDKEPERELGSDATVQRYKELYNIMVGVDDPDLAIELLLRLTTVESGH